MCQKIWTSPMKLSLDLLLANNKPPLNDARHNKPLDAVACFASRPARRCLIEFAPPRQLNRSASCFRETPMRIRNSLQVGILLAVGILVLIAASLSTATIQEKAMYRATGS